MKEELEAGGESCSAWPAISHACISNHVDLQIVPKSGRISKGRILRA